MLDDEALENEICEFCGKTFLEHEAGERERLKPRNRGWEPPKKPEAPCRGMRMAFISRLAFRNRKMIRDER